MTAGFRSTLLGDGPCTECGTSANIVWGTDSAFWNNVIRYEWIGAPSDPQDTYADHRWGHEPILCLPCFVKVAEERGFQPVAWRVVPEWPWRYDESARTRPSPEAL